MGVYPPSSRFRVRAIHGLDRRRWKARIDLANPIFEYFEIFHNRQRRHSALGMLTPIEFEARNDTVPCSMPVLQPGLIERRAPGAYIRLRVNQLFGDSGGMVNPFNGEGISYAIEVGLHAAEVVDRAFATRRTAHLNACDAALRQRWRGHHELGNAFAELVGNPTVMHV